MSATRRAWIAAVTVGAVQGLKDQGLGRWNQKTLGSIHQYAKKNYKGSASSFSLSRQLSSSSVFSSGIVQNQERSTKASEESLRKVMYLSCWGPN